ncbi:MAG: HAD family hydrolase [Cumulibacter sp.]
MKLAIFDCDGVLVDSEMLACQAQSDSLRERGFDLSADDVAARYIGISAADMRTDLERRFERVLPADHEERAAARLRSLFASQLRAIPGIADVLAAVKRMGLASCVASGSALDRIALALEVTGLASRFDGPIYSSTLVARGKPAPDLFLYAAAEMGYEPGRCIVIEDSVPGVQAACAAGMPVIGFTGASHCGPSHAERLRDAGADEVAGDSAELAARLRGF